MSDQPTNDWVFVVEEVSAGVYRASGTDRHGRRCEAIGEMSEVALAQCQAAAAELDDCENTVPRQLEFTAAVQFEWFLTQLRDWLVAGTLVPVPGPYGIDGSVVASILRGRVWPDVIDAEFSDRRGRRYHLTVETFHGSGGRWRMLPADLDAEGHAKELPP